MSLSRCPRAFADAASHSILNGDGMIEIGVIDGRVRERWTEERQKQVGKRAERRKNEGKKDRDRERRMEEGMVI